MKFMILAGIVLATTIIMSFFIVVAHEETHKTINSYFGIDSDIEYGLFTGRTVSEVDSKREDINIIMSLHSMNELVTYQFSMMFVIIGFTQVGSIILLGASVKRGKGD